MRTFRKQLPRWLMIALLAGAAVGLLTSAGRSAPGTGAPLANADDSPGSAHRIGVRVVSGIGEFYDRVTGAKFVPRGNIYIRLGPQTTLDGQHIITHSTFNPGSYDPARATLALQRMHADGYNMVRVWLSVYAIGDPSGGLSSAYLQNVVDFLSRAKANAISVILTQDFIPEYKYGPILRQDCCSQFAVGNLNVLSPSGLKANRLYFQDLVRDLSALGAPMDAIFAFELRNELSFETDLPPLSLTSGKIQTANGQIYNMSSPQDKKRMIDENLPYWMDQLRASIREIDPTALVTCGFFEPQQPNPSRAGDTRLVSTYPAIWQSQADFIDLHAYPGGDLTLKQYVENFQINGMQAKPILMGEFGAPVNAFSSADAAARALMAWQAESVQYGFDGWSLWTWDTQEQPELYNALSADGKIEKVLSPAVRPDPSAAQAPGLLENDIALGKNVTASQSLPDQPASNAVDGTGAPWGAGAFSPQWVQIDLGKPSTVVAIRLTVQQYPNGDTVHQIWVGSPSDLLHPVTQLAGQTRDNQVLEFKPAAPLTGVQYVHVVTVKSPSWVAWKEIEVIGP